MTSQAVRRRQSRQQNATRKANVARMEAAKQKDGKGAARVATSRAQAKKKAK